MSNHELQNKGWQHMQMLLDDEMPQKKRRRLIAYIPYAAAVALFTMISVWFYNHQDNSTPIKAELPNQPIQILPIETKTANSDFLKLDTEKAIKQSIKNRQDAQTEQTLAIVKKNTIEYRATPHTNIVQTPIIEQTETTQTANNTTSYQLNKQASQQSKANNTTQYREANKSVVKTDKSTLVSNQKQGELLFITPDIKKSFEPMREMGLTTNGTIGFVSENMEDYGLRLGLGVTKPIGKSFSASTAIRYSVYTDKYDSTYKTNTPEELNNNAYIANMKGRDVSRNFVEVPVYGTLHLNKNISVKSGLIGTYNTNDSESPNFSTSSVMNNSSLTNEAREEIGRLYQDKNGYLGEFLIGASLEMDKVSFDIEATRGFMNNQGIDNRNVVGMRIGYKFGQ